MDTPFFSGCSREKGSNTLFEWQTDTIAAGSANRQIEGDDSPAAT
ncbi:MAG: phage head protein, partial [Gemmatimonadetes bacterium]|nr:phage head protein [Gemmatimonadota bacterium]